MQLVHSLVRGSALRLTVIVLTAAFVGGCTVSGGAPLGVPTSAADTAYQPFEYDPAEPAPQLSLTDQDGQPFSIDQLAGRTVLVSFGYSHCPDVCPTTLGIDRSVLEARPDTASAVFVTVDPARDTAQALGAYLEYFDQPIVGLTGTDAQIAATAAAWGIGYQKGPVDASGAYSMAHTAGVFVVDPAGRLRYLYPYGTPSSVLIAMVDQLDQT